MTIDEIDQAIYDQYQFYAVAAPGVTPREAFDDGSFTPLGQLWALFDYQISKEAEA